MKKFLISLIIVLTLVAIGFWFYLPMLVGNSLTVYLKKEFPMEDISVEVKSGNNLNILLGSIDKIEINGTNVVLNNLRYKNISFMFEQIKIDPIALLFEHRFIFKEVGGGELNGSLTAEDLQTYLEGRVKNLKYVAISIHPRSMNLIGEIDIGGILTGKLEVNGEALLKDNILLFEPNGLRLNDRGVSGLAGVMGPIEIYDFNKFPIPVTANKVSMQEGLISIAAIPRK